MLYHSGNTSVLVKPTNSCSTAQFNGNTRHGFARNICRLFHEQKITKCCIFFFPMLAANESNPHKCDLSLPRSRSRTRGEGFVHNILDSKHPITADSALPLQGPQRFTLSQVNHIRFPNNHVCVRLYKDAEQNTRSIFGRLDSIFFQSFL